MMLERQEAAEGWWRDFRARIGAANPPEIHALFPEYFGTKDDADEIDKQARTEDGSRDYDRIDESKIKWSVPASDEEREEIESFLSEALSRTHTVTATELQEGGQWL